MRAQTAESAPTPAMVKMSRSAGPERMAKMAENKGAQGPGSRGGR